MKSTFFLYLLMISVLSMAQTRELKVTVTGKEDKPVKSVRLETFPSKQKASTDKTGVCILKNISDLDSLLITFPNSKVAGVYSLVGLNELQFSTLKSELVALNTASGTWINGQPRKVLRKGEFDVEAEIKNGAINLEDLLKRNPALMVTGGNISLRNPIQTNTLTNTAPLIVIDGMAVRGGLAEANRLVNIQTIESIEIERDGTLWGKDAVNGAIIIKLKK
jgi:hypothetical protein